MSLVSIARRPSHLLTSPSPRDGANHEGLERRYSTSLSDAAHNGSNHQNSSSADSSPIIPSARSADAVFTFNNNLDENCSSVLKLDTVSLEIEQRNDQITEGLSGQPLPSSNYYTIKGAAVFLNSQLTSASAVRPRTPIVKHDDSFFPSPSPSSPVPVSNNFYSPPSSPSNNLLLTPCHDWSPVPSRQAAEISRHLGLMLGRVRDEDQIMMAAKLESSCANRSRYLTLIYYSHLTSLDHNSSSHGGDCSSEESPASVSALLGFDVTWPEQNSEDDGIIPQERVTLGLAIPVQADMKIRLTGDGGFSTYLDDRYYSFKPVAVQVMWACLHSVTEAIARASHNVRCSSTLSPLFSAWLSFYNQNIDSDPVAIADWEIMDDVISRLPPADSESAIELQIRDQLRILMSSIDLEEASSRTIRSSLEAAMGRDLSSYRQFIDEEMLVLLGQLDLPSEIYDYLYLGSEWNASDIRVISRLGITHVVNVSREIDNFFPSQFRYFNVRVYDDESTELLRYWNSVYKFIESARRTNGRTLVHCKMGVSRSAACVIAYCMKVQGQSREEAIDFVRSRRACVQPNKGFMDQLQVYEGILKASRVRHSDLFRHVDTMVQDLSLPIRVSHSSRPVSYHESANVTITDPLFLTFPPGITLESRIAAFETNSQSQQHQAKLHERRLRNRTSPAMPSSTLEFPDGSGHLRRQKVVLMNKATGSKEDLSSSDAFYPESGHVRRVTAQLMTPVSSHTQSVSALASLKKRISAANNNNDNNNSNNENCQSSELPNDARRSSTGLDEPQNNPWPLCQQHETAEMVCEEK